MRKIISGVYKITNKTNGHFYIGSSVDIHKRWVSHKWYLNRNKSHNIAFQRAWEKYREESFDFSILLICDRENTTMYEQIYLDYYKPEYNIAIDALCPNKGKHLSEEHKRKIGETNSKHKMSDEQKEFLRQFHVGVHLSEEHKRKISEGNKGKHPVGTFKKGNVPWNKGIKNPFSEETTEKFRKAATGRKHTEEAKTKIGLASVEGEVLHAILYGETEISPGSQLFVEAFYGAVNEGEAHINVSSNLTIYGIAIILELCRIYKIEYEDRIMTIPYEDRIYNIEPYNSIYNIQKSEPIYSIEVEDNNYEVRCQ